jgi:hypothetical protein
MKSEDEAIDRAIHTSARDSHDVAKDIDDTTTLFIVFAAVIGLALANIGLSSLGLESRAASPTPSLASREPVLSRTTSCTCDRATDGDPDRLSLF